MNASTTKRWSAWDAGAVVLAGLLATVALIPQANAELQYADEVETAPAIEAPQVEERTTLRHALSASEKAQATLAQPALSAQIPTQVIVSQPQAVAQPQGGAQPQFAAQPVVAAQPYVQVGPALTSSESPEVQNLSKSELLRRERVRAELQNEDMLQQRLEELRLRDEQRRTEQLFGGQGGAFPAPSQPTATAPAPAAPMQEQVVVAPVTERPGQAVASVSSVLAQEPVATSAVDDSDKTILTLQPRAGIAEMSGETLYDIRPRFSTGVALGVISSDSLSFELGYTFSEYGVALATSNPYAQVAYAYGYAPSAETVAMKQNVIDAGIRLHVLGPDAKLRPFLGGGAAYSISYINYDQRILDILNRDPVLRATMASDYELNSYLGFLSGGLDLRISKSISVGALFKYYSVLSSRERSSLNNPAIYGGYYGYAYGGADADKQYVGGSLAKTSFYMMQGGVTFTF